jgi:hypothetical protein
MAMGQSHFGYFAREIVCSAAQSRNVERKSVDCDVAAAHPVQN